MSYNLTLYLSIEGPWDIRDLKEDRVTVRKIKGNDQEKLII